MKNALNAVAPIKAYCEDADNAVLRSFGEQLNACAPYATALNGN